MANSYQRKTKNGRTLKINGLPSHSLPIDMRLKNIKQQLNQGLSKSDSIWNNIVNDVKLATI